MNWSVDSGQDRLTGLPSAATFQQRLDAEAEAASLGGHDLTLVLLDVDAFSELNTALGYAICDDLLRHLAVRIAAFTEPGEMVSRLTADRFGWILPATGACDASRAVDALRSELHEVPPAAAAIRVSAGICALRDATHPSLMLRHAEAALRAAKDRGGDVSAHHRPGPDAREAAREARAEAVARLHELAGAVAARHPIMRGHACRVAALADVIALELGWDAHRRARLEETAALHDLGRPADAGAPCTAAVCGTGEAPGITRHAEVGAAIAGGVLDAEQVAWIRHQHERWDGAGGPHGLAGDAIPQGARIIAVATAMDVTTRTRRDPVPPTLARALAGCEASAGERFDPDVIGALARVLGVARTPARAAGGSAPEALRGGVVPPLPV